MRDVSKSFMELVITDKRPACATVEPELFFPLYTPGKDGEQREAEAKAVCARCPIKFECLEFALHTGDAWAVLGGMTPAERSALKRRNKAPVTYIPLEEAA